MKRLLIIAALVFMVAPSWAAVELDADANGGVDIGKGGTNATTAAGARTTLGVPAAADTLVGDCTVGPCLDGSSDGGNLIKLWAGTGSYWTALQGGAPAANRSWRLPILAPPSAGETNVMTMDEYGQMAFIDKPSTSGYVLTSTDAGVLSWTAPSGGGYTNLTSFVDQTNWRLFYSDGSGDVKELALGADGEYLKSNGASLAPSWATPSGAAHDAVTLGTDADILLGLSTQQITLDSQAANYFLAAPNGSAGDPTFRAIADADIPSAIARDSEIPAAATTSAAGLAPQAVAPAAGRRSVVAIDNAETGYKVAELFDATNPTAEASGSTASVGTAMTAARRDHRHAMPTIPNMAAPGAIGGTTPNTAAFTTLTAGTGTFSVDASGNVTATSLGTTRLAAEGGKTELYEGTNNGNNKVTIQAGASLSADKTIVAENIVETGGAIGAATATTPSAGDDDTSVPTTEWVNDEIKKKYVSGTEADFYGTLLDPQAIYAVDGTNHAVTIANNVPAAFTITEINVSCDANPTTEITLTFKHKAAGTGYGTPTTIEAVQTTDGAATITTGFDDATIPAGTKLFMTLSDPDDALNECSWQIEGDWD